MKEDQKETLKDVVNQSVVEDQMQSLFIYNEFFFVQLFFIIKKNRIIIENTNRM